MSRAACGNIRAAPACGNAPGPLSSPLYAFSEHSFEPGLRRSLLACRSESPAPPKPPDAFAVFPNLPLPPDAKFVSRAGSADALQLTLFSPGKADAVTDYYRDLLSKGKWRLVGDVKKPDGSVVLYAEQDGPPIVGADLAYQRQRRHDGRAGRRRGWEGDRENNGDGLGRSVWSKDRSQAEQVGAQSASSMSTKRNQRG